MRKLILLFLAAIAFSGCEGEQGPTGPMGPPGSVGQFAKQFTVRSELWEFDSEVGGYYYTFEISELTSAICRNGGVAAYIYVGNNVQAPLEYSRHYQRTGADDTQIFWTETISYQYAPGEISFFVDFSDFNYEPDDLLEPGTKDFRVVLTW